MEEFDTELQDEIDANFMALEIIQGLLKNDSDLLERKGDA